MDEKRDEPRWHVVHERHVELAKRKGQYDFEEARWLVEGQRLELHRHFGYGSYLEYLEHVYGYDRRTASERLRVAERLLTLPGLGAALRDGGLSWSAVRELGRVATPETEREWIDAAADQTARQIEQLVRDRNEGDRPTDPRRREARRHTLRYEVSAPTLAAMREAKKAAVQRLGHGVSDEELLELLCREFLGGPADEGRSPYQMTIQRCPDCATVAQIAGGERLVLTPREAERIDCDAQVVALPSAGTHVGPSGESGRLGPSGESTHVGPSGDVGGLGPSGEPTHVGPSGEPTHVGPSAKRATQTIPPAVRREVLARQGHACAVPGCAHAAFLEIHHLKLRSEGGDHDPEHLIALCGVHHGAFHTGRLLVEGTASSGFGFRHADGTPYGGRPKARETDAFATVHEVLRGMGYRDRDARRMLDRCRGEPLGDAQALLTTALRRAPVPACREALAVYARVPRAA